MDEQQPYIYQSAVGTDQDPAMQPGPGNWFVRHKRQLLIAGAALLVLLAVLLVVIFLINRHKAQVALQEKQQANEAAVVAEEVRGCDKKHDPSGCASSVQPSLARKTGKVSYCSGLTAEAYDNCVGLAALTSLREDACKLIADETKKTECLTAVKALKNRQPGEQSGQVQAAVAARNPALCAAVTLEEEQQICYELVGAADLDLDGLDVDEETALGTSDQSADSDSDGLTDIEEVNTWKTDPAKADTDGDGYPDGTEAKGGYNPLGSGKL